MERVRIGFWGGCFNPPTNVHINLANELVKEEIVDKVIFIPVGDYYKKPNLALAKDRYNMLKLYCNSLKNIEVNDIASSQTNMLYAIDTFKIINKKFINSDIYFIMGSDNFIKMSGWKSYDEAIKNYKYIVIERLGYERECNLENVVYYKPKQEAGVDSTQIRRMLRNNENVENWINEDVLKYIQINNLYQDI